MGCAVLLSFLCGILVNKIPHGGIAVISNTTVCDVCAFKPMVFSKMKLYAVLRHGEIGSSVRRFLNVWKIAELMTLIALQKICITCGQFPFFKKPYRPCKSWT